MGVAKIHQQERNFGIFQTVQSERNQLARCGSRCLLSASTGSPDCVEISHLSEAGPLFQPRVVERVGDSEKGASRTCGLGGGTRSSRAIHNKAWVRERAKPRGSKYEAVGFRALPQKFPIVPSHFLCVGAVLQIRVREAASDVTRPPKVCPPGPGGPGFRALRLTQNRFGVRNVFQLRDRRETLGQMYLPLVGEIGAIAARGSTNQRAIGIDGGNLYQGLGQSIPNWVAGIGQVQNAAGFRSAFFPRSGRQ